MLQTAGADAKRWDERPAQHMDAVPVGDQRDVFPVRLLHRGGRQSGAGLPGHGAGCHDDSPLESRKVQGADRAASQGAYERGLRAASVPAGMVYGRHGRKAF